jgi:hypothetical protein
VVDHQKPKPYRLVSFFNDSLRPKKSSFKFRDLFVDCLVTTGSNPTVLLLTELIESGAISATQAEWAMMSLGHYIKTPTFELLRRLMVTTFT